MGGIAEFIASISVIMTFNAAQKANINQGIGTNIMICNAVIVSILSFCFLGEVVSKAQVFGILVIIAAVALVSAFPPKSTQDPTVTQHGVQERSEVNPAEQMVLVVVWGIVGALSLSFEIMSNKWLIIRRGINGDVSGMFFLLIEGLLGTLCLIFTTLQGSGLYEVSEKSFVMIMVAGLLAFTALVMLNYAIAKGLAGVAISIFNTNPSIQVLLSSLFLGQVITPGQITGVVLSLAGACVLSMGDLVLEKLFGRASK